MVGEGVRYIDGDFDGQVFDEPLENVVFTGDLVRCIFNKSVKGCIFHGDVARSHFNNTTSHGTTFKGAAENNFFYAAEEGESGRAVLIGVTFEQPPQKIRLYALPQPRSFAQRLLDRAL